MLLHKQKQKTNDGNCLDDVVTISVLTLMVYFKCLNNVGLSETFDVNY